MIYNLIYLGMNVPNGLENAGSAFPMVLGACGMAALITLLIQMRSYRYAPTSAKRNVKDAYTVR